MYVKLITNNTTYVHYATMCMTPLVNYTLVNTWKFMNSITYEFVFLGRVSQ